MENTTEKMVELLLSRAKMLRYHCPKCKSPLFEKEGKVLCATCGPVKVKKGEKGGGGGEEMLVKKRDELLSKLEKTSDPEEISRLAEAIKKLEALL